MRFTILLFGLISLSLSTYGQSDSADTRSGIDSSHHKKWKYGFVIKLNGDTIKGKVKLPGIFGRENWDSWNKVSFEDKGGITTVYASKDIKSFTYYKDLGEIPDTITMISVDPPEQPGVKDKIFCKLYLDGPCKVFGYHITTGSPVSFGVSSGPFVVGGFNYAGYDMNERIYIQTRGSDAFQMKRIGFKKTMKEFFTNCPVIISKLNSKTYTYDNWEEMVKDYNRGICK